MRDFGNPITKANHCLLILFNHGHDGDCHGLDNGLDERCKEYFIRYWNQYQGLASPSADTTFHQYTEHHVQNGMKHVPIDARRQIDSILQEIAAQLFGGAC